MDHKRNEGKCGLNVGKSDKASEVKHEREKRLAPLGFSIAACLTRAYTSSDSDRGSRFHCRGPTWLGSFLP
jgi:hypothetical protein